MSPQVWMYAGEALIAASYLAAAYQDLRSREVEDLTWIPAGAGLALMLILGPRSLLVPLLVKVGIMAALAAIWRRMGFMASGDVPALAFIGASGCYLSPVPELAASLIAVLAIWAAEARLRLRMVVDPEEAMRSGKWIPRRILGEDGGELEDLSGRTPEEAFEALERWRGKDAGGVRAEVSYGVPMAAALGVGYVLARIALLLMGSACA
ncbi:MAG: A24 family peptidase [Conexivisphaera sp.]|jgi:hypothetical protein